MLGLFLGKLIFGGVYYWREFCVSQRVGLDNLNSLKYYENSLKQLKTASTNSPLAYFQEGSLLEGYLGVSEIWGTYFREGSFLEGGGLVIGILWYSYVEVLHVFR